MSDYYYRIVYDDGIISIFGQDGELIYRDVERHDKDYFALFAAGVEEQMALDNLEYLKENPDAN